MANNNIIQLAAARPRRSPPGSAAFEPTRRAIEARLNGAALRERIRHRERIVRSQTRIGLACRILSALVVLYFGAELARAVWS